MGKEEENQNWKLHQIELPFVVQF